MSPFHIGNFFYDEPVESGKPGVPAVLLDPCSVSRHTGTIPNNTELIFKMFQNMPLKKLVVTNEDTFREKRTVGERFVDK